MILAQFALSGIEKLVSSQCGLQVPEISLSRNVTFLEDVHCSAYLP